MIDPAESPINGLTFAPEWAGTNIYLACREVGDHTDTLYPDEKVSIERAMPRRKNTFSSGRLCARAAMAEAGLPAASLPRNEDGSIAWPDGVIGSVSHTDDWAVAAVAIEAMCEARALGVDLERIQALEPGVLNLVANKAEREEITDGGGKHWHATALFGLKESLYKCLRPAYGEFIEFHDVEIRALASGRPQVEFVNESLRELCNPEDLELRMAVTPSFVFSLVWWRNR